MRSCPDTDIDSMTQVEFINSDSEKPHATRSGRAMSRRSDIDFSFF